VPAGEPHYAADLKKTIAIRTNEAISGHVLIMSTDPREIISQSGMTILPMLVIAVTIG
jgi:hypothetical protein